MPIVPFRELMREAASAQYAVGYFESWNLESLLAVADAAIATRSPVILGFSGIYVPFAERSFSERLSVFASLGIELCQQLPVPACLLFNESSHFEWVMRAIESGFGLVMFTDESLGLAEQQEKVRQVVERAHANGAAVEGEVLPLPGVSAHLSEIPDDLRLTPIGFACTFVESTGVDALAVNLGQAHLHGQKQLSLNLSRLAELRQALSIPLVLHGATSIDRRSLSEAISLGIRKINVGSSLKRAFFEAVRDSCMKAGAHYNPYDVVGSGHTNDVLAAGRDAVRRTVEDLMYLFGSAGKA